MRINTVTGRIETSELGKTLMHEHLMVGYPGWELDVVEPGPSFRDLVEVCVDRIEELKSAGYRSLLDPCPNDMGRSVELMGEVAARTGFNIICTTGLYNEQEGASSYWRAKSHYNPDYAEELAELFVRELTDGVADTGIRASAIKIATGKGAITEYEAGVFAAAAAASKATGAPITTHTEGQLGPEQLALLASLGVEPHRVVVGHSCDNPDHAYHMQIAAAGAYVGFDRLGLEYSVSNAGKADNLVRLIEAGAGGRVAIAHDSVWCLRGRLFSRDAAARFASTHRALQFTRVFAPMLRAAGVTDEAIEAMQRDNPRRYFEGRSPPAIAPAHAH